MTTAIVIPARRASSRLPDKMLLSATGKPLLQHTYEQACQAKQASRVLIATDDESIEAVAKQFGAEVVMTSPTHPTGTDRISEVAEKYLSDVDCIVNVQGDEPEIDPRQIDQLISLFQAANAEMGTLVTPFGKHCLEGPGSPYDPHCVKAVLGHTVKNNNIILGYQTLYFSRNLIPYPRDKNGTIMDPTDYYLHLGIYCYTPEFVKQYVKLPQGKLENVEKLEQLRVLEHGYRIVAAVVPHATPGIDTQADYEQFTQRYRKHQNAICA
jgi:3-deoxy-manno-octulosonate cytidylyltransferase (CMP-KDO synthetase)